MNTRRIKELISKSPFLLAMCNVIRHYKDEEFINRVNDTKPAFLIEKSTLQLSRGKTYYVIDHNWDTCGFFAIMHRCLMGLCVADAMGFVPYINVQNSICNIKGGWHGTDNMYEYYFLQPVPDTLERIKKEENCFLSNYSAWSVIRKNFTEGRIYEFEDQQLRYMGTIAQKYMHLRPELEQAFSDEISALLGEKKNLGIHYRGSDFKLGFQNHPVVLSVEQYFAFVDEALQNGFEQIFLATDDTAAVEAFRERYGRIVVAYSDVARTEGTTGVHLMNYEMEEEKYYRGREVLRDMLTLSQCSGLLAGNSHVSEFARIWKYAQGTEFEYLNILSNGLNQQYSKEAKQYISALRKRINAAQAGNPDKKD